MLDLNSRFDLLGVTLYRDADQKTVFFYLPQNPVIPRDAAGLMFDLMLYEKGGQGADLDTGGFLTLAISTGLGALERPLLRELRKQFGDGARLTSIPFTEGSVRLAGLDTGVAPVNEDGTGAASDPGPAGIRLVEKVFGTATPNLDGDNRAVFSLSLSEEGAAFFAELLEQGIAARPLIAIYDLKYTGLMEVESLKIEIDFSRVYDFLRTRIGFNAIVVAGEIDNIVEELRDNQAIRIDDTVRSLELSTPEAMKERQTRIDALVKELATGAFFAPSLTLGDPAVNEAEVFAAPSADQAGLFRQGVPAAVGQAMAHAVTRREQAREVDINTPEPEPGEGTPAPAADTAVQNTNAAMGAPRATFTMRRLQQRELRKVTYDMSRTTAMQRSTGPQNPLLFMASAREIQSRIHKINLNHPFFARLRIDVDAGGTDFAAEGIREMTVNLRYGTRADGRPRETGDVVLRTAADRASFVFARDGLAASAYEYQLTVHYLPGAGLGDPRTSITAPWTLTESRTLSVRPSMVARRKAVTLSLPRALPPDLAEVRATVAYVDARQVIDDRRSFVVVPGGGDVAAQVRFDSAGDSIKISGQAIFTDGRIVALPDQVRPDPSGSLPDDVVVLAVPSRPSVRFSAMLSDPLDELRSVILEYEVKQGGTLIGTAAVELTDAQVSIPVSMVLSTEVPLPEVRVRERRIFDSGGVETTPFRPLTDIMVIAGIPATDVLDVTVQYIGQPMETVGILGIMVTLRYAASDGDPDFAQTTSLFVENRDIQRWQARIKNRNERTFTYETTLMMQSGGDRVLPAVTTDNPRVFLRVTP